MDYDDCPWFGQPLATKQDLLNYEKKLNKDTNIGRKTKKKKMKTKSGTAKPSGSIGKGGPSTSPTDGKSLKVKGGKSPKKGKK